MNSSKKSKIYGMAIMGLMLFISIAALTIKTTDAFPVPDPFYQEPYYKRVYHSEGYLNENGEDGDWMPDDIVSLGQLVVRPTIPGTIKQATTQFSVNTIDISAKISASAEVETSIGVDAVASGDSSYSVEAEAEAGYIRETTSKQTTTISLAYGSAYELAFSATVYEIKVSQYYTCYAIEKYLPQYDGPTLYLGIDHYEMDVDTKILDVQTTEYLGISYNHDSSTHRAYYPYIASLYPDIVAGDYTESTSSTMVWGSSLVSYEDERESKDTFYGGITVSFTKGWGTELGFGGTSTETSFEVSISGTVKGSNVDGKTEIATFESGFYGSGDNYRVTLHYLECGAFWVKGTLETPPPPASNPFPFLF